MTFRAILFLSIAILFTACMDDDDAVTRMPLTCSVPGANQQGDLIQVPNDAGFVLVRSVENMLCPCDVACVSAGTIDVTFELGEESVTIRRDPGPDIGTARDSLGPWLISLDTVYNTNLCPGEIAVEDICLGITFR